MATRTFLSESELTEARKMLRAPLATPRGQVLLDHSLTASLDFSSWLSLLVENRFREVDGWEAASPIAIGSWGRGELCPASDLDVVFCGDQKAVLKVVSHAESLGLKFRYRVPDDLDDWTQNVEVLEVNALFRAKAFTQDGAEKLQIQKDKILGSEKTFRRELLKAMMTERKLRVKRYDSIANFLEPNLKFGAGGLRDLHQAIILKDWFSERFEENEYAFKVLEYYKCLFLMIRQKLHLQNSHDMLTASDQHDLVSWFGFDNHRDFMMEVQKGLARVSFHSRWVNERCGLTQKDLKDLSEWEPANWQESLRALKKDSRYQIQGAIRKKLYETKGFKKEKLTKKEKGQILKKLLDIKQEDEVTESGFKSHMVSHLNPNFTRVIGLVQHDQYHRYSVDAHLLQAVKEVRRIYQYPKLLGRLEYYAEKLNMTDWNILRWAALYHDIAKGQKGDHSKLGRELAIKDLRAYGFPKEFYLEVAWLTENHLILSTAAFRQNPQAPSTFETLFKRGVRGKRIYRLAIFTAIDIMATNPEAWNSWKENLLFEMAETLRNPSQERHYEFAQKVKKQCPEVPDKFIYNLDSSLEESVSQKVLIRDFKDIVAGEDLEPLVLRDKRKRVWVRFYQKKDRSGLVLDYTQRLTAVGANIRQAFIHTDEKMGVYDWFCVKTTKSVNVLRKQLLHNISSTAEPNVPFSQIDLISWDENEWVFSFRARDKKGLLLSAIQALHRNELQIIWAKVHTWGRQIDDIFGVLPKNNENPEKILTVLKRELEVPDLEIL